MTSIDITELHQHLPEYLKQVQAGEEVVITVHGKAIARILTLPAQESLTAGRNTGQLACAAISLWEIAVLFREVWCIRSCI